MGISDLNRILGNSVYLFLHLIYAIANLMKLDETIRINYNYYKGI